jgi:hypothetical protein
LSVDVTLDATSLLEDGENPTTALQSALTAANSEIAATDSLVDAIQSGLTTVGEFAEIQMEADAAGSEAIIGTYIGDLSENQGTIPRANASKITNSHVLGSNTWSFVIFDGVSRVLLPRISSGCVV